MTTAQLDYTPPQPDATSLPDSLKQLLESKGLAWSFQRHHEVSLRLLGVIPGMMAVTGTKIKEWDPEVAAELFSETSIFGYELHNDLIRNGDTVLCAMPVTEREKLMELDRARRAKQQGKTGDPARDELREALAELGVHVPEEGDIAGMQGKEGGTAVAVHGYDSQEDAAKKGVRRRVTKKTKE